MRLLILVVVVVVVVRILLLPVQALPLSIPRLIHPHLLPSRNRYASHLFFVCFHILHFDFFF